MPSVTWSPRALRDLERFREFLEPKSEQAAQRAALLIRDAVRHLANTPQMGRLTEGLLPGFRELIIQFGRGAYIVRYHFDGKRLLILSLRHSRETED